MICKPNFNQNEELPPLDSAENLFREYLHLRSRMVVYVAIGLALLGVFTLFALLGSNGENINRFGLLLEWLAVLAVGPHLLGLRRPSSQPEAVVTPPPDQQEAPVVVDGLTGRPIPEDPATSAGPSKASGGAPANASQPSASAPGVNWEADIFRYYQKANTSIVLGNIMAALGTIWLMVAAVLYPESLSFPEEVFLRVLVSLVGFAWLNLFMLVQILLMANTAIPGGMLAGFFTVDLLLGFIGVVFAGMIHILRKWLGRGLGFVFQNGARRVLLAITLPFLLMGLALQILATYLP